MNVGSAIRQARERKQLGRGAAARRAGVKLDTWKKIEMGKSGVSLPMLEKIARALEVNLSELLPEQASSEKGTGHLSNVVQPRIDLAADDEGDSTKDQVASPEVSICKGDEAAARGAWATALAHYEEAEQRMPRRDYTWARLVLERSAQMLINLDAVDRLDEKLKQVDDVYPPAAPNEPLSSDAQRIRMLLAEKRTWKGIWVGNPQVAESQAREALQLAEILGDEPRVKETGLHFIGRALCEAPTTAMFYHRLFPQLTSQAFRNSRLDEAAVYLGRSRALDTEELNLAFNGQWEARVRRGLGQTVEAVRLDRYWYGLAGGNEGAAEAHLDRAKTLLLEQDHDRNPDVTSAEDIVNETLVPFSRWQYAAGLAEATITKAYIRFLKRQYRTPQARQYFLDLCVVAQCLHPYPLHPIYRIGVALIPYALFSMSGPEYRDYMANVNLRLSAGDGALKLVQFAFQRQPEGFDRILSTLHQLRTAYRNEP